MTTRSERLRAALARSHAGSAGPQLDDETFLGLRDLIADESGIAFDERSRFIVERRLLPRLRALRIPDFETYYRWLLYGPDAGDEVVRLLEAVTIRETYFFREWPQLEAFRDELLPRLAREIGPSGRLRIWSAGCATGEEPYSVAILLRESGLFDAGQVEIHGTDLVPKAVAAAYDGLYRDASLRSTPEHLRSRYFTREGENAWRLDERVRAMVTFGTGNLVDATCVPVPGADVIFCRNVLIYFDDETRRRVVGAFYDDLRTGGYLLLGHAESLLSLSTPFTLRHAGRDVVYQK